MAKNTYDEQRTYEDCYDSDGSNNPSIDAIPICVSTEYFYDLFQTIVTS